MIVNDPIGDMLTRIRNAQERRRPKVVTPASNLRAHVLDVLAQEGYIRGYTRVEPKGGHPTLEIELVLQRPTGDQGYPAGIKARPPGVCPGQGTGARCQRSGRCHRLHAQGRDVR